MASYVTVANSDELRAGECKVVSANGKNVAIYNLGNRYCATENSCPHKGGPLGDGELDGEIVTCPWHEWRFNVRTGQSTDDDTLKLATYEVRVDGSEIQIRFNHR